MTITRLIACLCVFVSLTSSLAAKSEPDEDFFKNLVQQDIAKADLALALRVINIRALESDGHRTRYWIEGEVQEVFAGQAGSRQVFYQWAESNLTNLYRGKTLLASLKLNAQSGLYFAGDNGFVLEATNSLLAHARWASLKNRAKANSTTGWDCRPGLHHQPDGPFALQVFCDDALGSQISIQLHDLAAPIAGPYSLSQRHWQGDDWSRDVTAFLWDRSGKSLFVTTSPVYGTGSLYRLDLQDQKAERLWTVAEGDCLPKLESQGETGLHLRIEACDQETFRSIEVSLP